MRPGLVLQHGAERSVDNTKVRSDIAGFIGVVPRPRWPKNVKSGDFLEYPLFSYSELANSPARVLFDAVTCRAVKAFFQNGGVQCRLFGLMVASEQDLMVNDPFNRLFHPLIDRLRGQEDIGMICMPVLGYLPIQFVSGNQAIVPCQPIWEMLLLHCQEMHNRFLIMDTPRDLHGPPLMSWVMRFRKKMKHAASFAAIYYPWLMAGDADMPPSGSMAGVYAGLEHKYNPYGVRWPPANLAIKGATHTATEVLWKEVGDFTECGINPIIVETGRGVVIWGARTLSEADQWKHINTRRIVSYIREQLYRDSAWAVFENNNHDLWKVLERVVTYRLQQCGEGGLLAGSEDGADFIVQCDAETNRKEIVNAGQIHVRVWIKPVSTTERILVDMRLGANDMTV